MRLVLFEVLGIKIYSYGLMIAIGILFAGTMFLKRGKTKGYDENKLSNLMIISIIMGILGGKLLFIITDLKNIIENPKSILNFGEGFVVYGGIIFGALTVFLYCKKQKWNVMDIFDCIVPGLAMAQGFGRIGCFLAGCCYGKETDLFLGVKFPIDSLAPAGVYLHPTQLYSSVFDFALATFLIVYSRDERKKGRIASLYVILYSIGRFIIEFLRNDERGSVAFLSTSQFIAIFTLILGLVLFNLDKIKGRGKNIEQM